MQIPKTLGFLPVNILGLCLYSEYVTPKGATHILRIIIPGERSTALSPLLWPQDSQWHLCASFRCARPLEPSATALTIGHSLPCSSGGRKSTVKVLAGRLLPRPLCRASRWPSSLCVLTRSSLPVVRVLISYGNHSDSGQRHPPQRPHCTLITSVSNPSPDTVTG